MTMTTRLRSYWERVRTNYWMLPALMSVGAILLATLALHLDARIAGSGGSAGWLWRGGSEGAQQVLSTIASSTITVAGVVFSITLVVFTMASGQFGPRVLRNFMRDLGNQIVLGTFVSTFLYCLLVLRSVHEVGEGGYVPRLSVTLALTLSVVSLAVLIYFIHHVCDSIQAENLVAHVGRELEGAIKETFPRQRPTGSDGNREVVETEFPEDLHTPCHEVRASHSGYLQAIEIETLMEIAATHDLQLRLLQHPGNFVAERNLLLQALPMERCDPALVERLEKTFILGRHRTPTQDIDYSVHQLVEIAVRALSPAINDPYTAIACIDWLGAAMNLMSERETPSQYHRDAHGMIRLTLHTQTFAGMLDRAFHQIRQYGAQSPAVLIRLIETFTRIASNLRRPNDWKALRVHAQCVIDDARRNIGNATDLAAFEARYRHFLEVCETRSGEASPDSAEECPLTGRP